MWISQRVPEIYNKWDVCLFVGGGIAGVAWE